MPIPKKQRDKEIPFLRPISTAEKRAEILDDREIDVTSLNDDERIARDTRNRIKLAAVSLWLHDSIAWMEAAVHMDNLSRRCAPNGERIDHHRANVAHTAAGYAYELLMKSIVKADDASVRPTHSVRQAFERLGKERKREIGMATAAQGIAEIGQFLDDIDERLCDKNRKYWMFKTNMWTAGAVSFQIADGPGSIAGWARIHQEIVGVGQRALEECREIRSRELVAIRTALTNKPGEQP